MLDYLAGAWKVTYAVALVVLVWEATQPLVLTW